ncbi:unnamed protein product [Haemonchus placei]|uniref:P-type phospholipid transporter n=1 Tax=Haemonchus placei TaxID=6290 RepID=A0A158QRE6_HAEPC|nr:unnamed protein product [Haemonchus placei]
MKCRLELNPSKDSNMTNFKLGERAPPSNMVRTNNYTYINFLPKFLYAQFKQVANLFFLVLSFIQTLPGLSPFGRQATILPLSFIIGTSAIREIYEDVRRRVRDRKMNFQKCYAHTDEGWKMIPWCELHVGQLIRAVNGEQLAADCLILATSEPGSVVYVETANLDGESNLKEFWQSGVEIFYDVPNGNIYEFQGHMTGKSHLLQTSAESASLSTDRVSWGAIPANAHVILRGARLKNTDNIYGIVLYTVSHILLQLYGIVCTSLNLLQDETMIDENGRGPDVKMFSLNSELGDVKYVMSDKTGTLTQNCMRFRMCSVGGVKYANRRSRRDKKNAHQIRDFLLSCALCHTASPDKNTSTSDRPLYHATSPDEHALLDFAASAGFIFKKRAPGKCILNVLGTTVEYDLVAILEFDSQRKRMSVIVKEPGGNYKLYIKGANPQYSYMEAHLQDQKIFERLKNVSQKELKRTAGHLQQFAIGGHRTLCFAVRTIDTATFTAWYKEYIQAINDTTRRKSRLAELAEVIEKELVLIGVSAIEDRLQKRVPETVRRLIAAGIRVWVLSGDKLETAVNIAKYLKILGEKVLSRRDQQISLIVDATCLDFILVEQTDRDQFLRLALCCSAVICCRCTPFQKAAVTRLVKANVCGAVLAIGDGANDVAMLQEADVGVGISGQEGMQAALASDYTISQGTDKIYLQFYHLDRLLFVHGTLSLFRTSKCILFSLYKNVLETCVLSFYTYVNGHSVQTIADEWTVLFYNMFFTSFPALIMGIFDRPAPISSLIKYPQLYSYYQNSLSNWYVPLIPRALGGVLLVVPPIALVLVVLLVAIAALLPDVAIKVFRRALRADMQDAMLWHEGIRGSQFNILYQPIFKMCDIVGLKTYGELESNRYGFAFAQDDGVAITQMDLLQEHSADSLSLQTPGIQEPSEPNDCVKENERSVDDKTVVSSLSEKSPKMKAEAVEPTKNHNSS